MVLALLSTTLVAWSLSGSLGRREALAAVALSSVAALPEPALAQRSSLIPRSSKESTASFKAYQLSAPGEETEAFKAAEAKRRAAAAQLPAGASSRKEETAEDQMKRLGMTTYADGLKAGRPDPCGEGSFACGRSK